MLSLALGSTGLAGHPFECFNPVLLDKPPLRDILGNSSLLEGMDMVLRAGTSANGVFGAKMHWGHFRFLGMAALGEWNGITWSAMLDLLLKQLPHLLSEEQASSLLEEQFGRLDYHAQALELLRSKMPDLRLIWLCRRDMSARAVSHYRAQASAEFFRKAGDPPPERIHAPEFDLGRIHSVHLLGCFLQRSWKSFFKLHNIEPHCVIYEDLVDRYGETVRSVLRFLDLEAEGAKIPPPASARQADGLSQEWKQRYLALIEAKGSAAV